MQMVYNYDVLNFGGSPEPQAQWRLPALAHDREALGEFVQDLLGTSHDMLVLLKEGQLIAEGWFDGITLHISLRPGSE